MRSKVSHSNVWLMSAFTCSLKLSAGLSWHNQWNWKCLLKSAPSMQKRGFYCIHWLSCLLDRKENWLVFVRRWCNAPSRGDAMAGPAMQWESEMMQDDFAVRLKSSAAQHADAAKLKDVYRMHWFQTEKYFAWYSKAVMHSCQSKVQHCSTYSAKADSLHFTFNAFHSSLPRQAWTCLPYNINPTPSQFDSKSRIFPSLPASFYLSY